MAYFIPADHATEIVRNAITPVPDWLPASLSKLGLKSSSVRINNQLIKLYDACETVELAREVQAKSQLGWDSF
jgi:hypothetical protein